MTLEESLDKFTVLRVNLRNNEISFRYPRFGKTESTNLNSAWVSLMIHLNTGTYRICHNWWGGMNHTEFTEIPDVRKCLEYYESRYDLTGLKRMQ